MKRNKKQDGLKWNKRKYEAPLVQSIQIDHEISLVMMSESTEPPPENIGLTFNPLKFLR